MEEYTFPRQITTSEVDRLADDYNDFYNASGGRSAVLAGGDDPEELGLTPGDLYSTLEYDSQIDQYYWNHSNIVKAEPEPQGEDLGIMAVWCGVSPDN